MQKKVYHFIRKYEMVQPGDMVVAAVSGGADSVCLLHLLTSLREEFHIGITAVHVHHGIRGAEADRDADYVKELCRKLEVPCLVVHKNVPAYGKERGLSLEEAGRILRYQAFREEAANHPSAKIAVAHHGDDQAETILHNLFRGSGLKGLGGMSPVRDDVIRPLLCCSRVEIIEYLTENGIEYCEDSTNALTDYTRNKLRNSLIPMVVEEINQGAVEHILRAGEMVSQADAYLASVAHGFLEEWAKQSEGRIGVPSDVLVAREPVIQTYVVMEMMARICGSRKDITAKHVSQVLELAEKTVGARTNLPYGLTGRKGYGELWIEDKNICMPVDNPGQKDLPELVFSLFPYEKHQEIPENQYTKWFDYDKIKGTLSVRTRQTGDYITLKEGRRKSVKTYMIDEKIPRERREMVPLLAEGQHILWIVGYRISEFYKVTDKTKQILQVKMDGGKDGGR